MMDEKPNRGTIRRAATGHVPRRMRRSKVAVEAAIEPALRINVSGRCDQRARHDAHIIDRGDGTGHDCPGQGSDCANCDGRKCMSCVFREVHDGCEDSCPDCCFDDIPVPSLIVIFCDRCGTEHAGEYWVGENDDQATRFGYGRVAARAAGWAIADGSDLCPDCAGQAEPGPEIVALVARARKSYRNLDGLIVVSPKLVAELADAVEARL